MKAKAAISGAQAFAANVTGTATNVIEGEYRKRLEGLNDQLKSGQISEEEFAKKKEALDKQKALKTYQIEKKQFLIDKAAALAKVAIDTATAVTKVTAQTGVGAAAITPFIIAQGIANATEIATRQPPPPPTFAQGGDVFGAMVGGKLHSEGGTKYYGEDGNAFEVEKGEGIFVTKRSATNKALQLLNDANMSSGGASMFGSTTRFAQEGGQIDQASQAETMAGMIATAIQNMPSPVVKVEDIQSGMVANKESTEIGVV